MNAYYSNQLIQSRMLEFLGGSTLKNITCKYLTSGDRRDFRHRDPLPIEELPKLWQQEVEVCRSLWDRESLIIHLDIEYVNFDFPGEAYLDPKRTYDLQHFVELVIQAVLRDSGVTALHLLSGRGHHFVWRVRQDSNAFRRLAKLGRVSPSLKRLNDLPHRPDGKSIRPTLGAAFAGLGLVMEFLGHCIKKESAPMCKIPVELTAVEVGPRGCGREMISIDLSEYGDPLSTRVVRVPFSYYLKPWQQRNIIGEEIVRKLPSIFLIPMHDMGFEESSDVMTNIRQVTELAERASAKIPDQSVPMEALITAYEKSSLRQFHDSFYAEEPDPPNKWPETYDRTPLAVLPSCARFILEHPNDLLLRPANIERVVRVMLSLGWHPRHIVGLIRSKFERDYGWGNSWDGYDPATRAEFYVRLFAGLFATGHDNLVDFNCQSAKEERLCFAADCRFNLELYKKSLLNRRTHERLACRPFNGLFLPEKHL